MLISTKVDVIIGRANVVYYKNLGYISKDIENKYLFKKIISVDIKDLRSACNSIVECQCDGCEKYFEDMRWSNYFRSVRDDGKIYCKKCANHAYGNANMVFQKLLKGKSFYQWCMDNNRQDLLKRWDYSKNDIDPKEICFSARREIYFLCENNIHESLAISLNQLTGKGKGGNFKCVPCNSIALTNPNCLLFWSDKNTLSPYRLSFGSDEFTFWKCPKGKHDDFSRATKHAIAFDFRCPECSFESNVSILQNKVSNYLNNLGFDVKHERNCSIICKNPKTNNNRGLMPYDNEIVYKNCHIIIEVHGIQHYYVNSWNNLSDNPKDELAYIQWKDEYKKQYVLSQGYYYLAIPFTADNKKETYKKSIDEMLEYIYQNN